MNFDTNNQIPASSDSASDSLQQAQPEGRLHPTAERALQASDSDRTKMIIQDHLIHYPTMKQVMSEADWMVHEPRQVRARGLIVCSGRGNGKTSLADLIHRHYSEYHDPDLPSVVRVSISGVRDPRALYGRILEELGSPARISHRLSDRELLVQRLLRDVDCRLLILDEVQDVLLGSEREQQRALEGIKLLMNEVHLPVLAFGTESAGKAFIADPHLQARFVQVSMPAWKADSTLANFLAAYERVLPLKKPSNLAAPDNLKYLSKASEGILGRIVERVKNAALAAIADGTEHITLDGLRKAITRPAVCGLLPGNPAR